MAARVRSTTVAERPKLPSNCSTKHSQWRTRVEVNTLTNFAPDAVNDSRYHSSQLTPASTARSARTGKTDTQAQTDRYNPGQLCATMEGCMLQNDDPNNSDTGSSKYLAYLACV